MNFKDIKPTPVDILYPRYVQRLHEFDNIDRRYIHSASVLFKLNNKCYSTQRRHFKFVVFTGKDDTCGDTVHDADRDSISIGDIDDLMNWFNTLDHTRIEWVRFREPKGIQFY